MRPKRPARRIAWVIPCALWLLATAPPGRAATLEITGRGSFEVPPADQLARLPADAPFSRADLASGRIAFSFLLDDSVRDADADPYVGRYPGAVHRFTVTVGQSSVRLPDSDTELSVSDGGLGEVSRESIRARASMQAGRNALKVDWVQVNQQAATTDLRGAPGALPSDAMPPRATLVDPTRFERSLVVELNAVRGQGRVLLYLKTSTLIVTVAIPAPSGRAAAGR